MGRDPSVLSGLIILIVESKPIARDSLMNILEAAGAHTHFEEQIQEALAGFRSFIPDCIFCNVSLADGSGYLLIQQLRQLEMDIGIAHTPAIAVFESESAMDPQHSLEAGFHASVAQPWHTQAVINTVLNVTGRGRRKSD